MIRFVNMRELKNREEDFEDYLLAHSQKFLKSLDASYREYNRKGGIPLEKLLAGTERELARLRR